MTATQLSQLINDVLPNIPLKQEMLSRYFKPHLKKYIQKNSEAHDTIKFVVSVMEQKSLIEVHHHVGELDYYGRISQFGMEIRDSGGWLKYLQDEKANAEQDNTIKELTLSQLKGSIFQIKYWWLIVVISAILGAVISKVIEVLL